MPYFFRTTSLKRFRDRKILMLSKLKTGDAERKV